MNPSPMTHRLMDNPETSPSSNGISVPEKLDEKTTQLMPSKRTILQQLQVQLICTVKPLHMQDWLNLEL
uniref:Uncharacterized protein n=1 Tax=Nelumbo nucifera TaxID=4432 RepID=A0A822YYY9_NELNU|nr:TPA_asm: hypothetical protein HUJ06_008094 [Nelumbo nucifera]